MPSFSIPPQPYVGLNFVFFEKLRNRFLADSVEHDYSETRIALTKLACGAVAGGTSQTITYPFDVIRRKMQVVGLQRAAAASSSTSSAPSLAPAPAPSATLVPSRAFFSTAQPAGKPQPYTYTSGTGAFVQIFQREGLKGLYRGIIPNVLKVAPSMGVSF